ncbi:MAG: hypothetical protein ACXVZL_02455 [Gaiellaceae bacterium]
MGRGKSGVVGLACAFALLGAQPALADGSWLPHPADATWTYAFTDSVYSPAQTKEKVTVKDQKGPSFTLAWTTDGLDNAADALTSSGTVSFQETTGGLINTNWTSTPPPPEFPILCAAVAQCGNSLASTYYNVIWGGRVPVLAEPLLQGAAWSATGASQNDVGSSSEYLGTETITVPAFKDPVVAAKVRSDITQAGALGDPYGSGVRTIWWVYGVGPVKIEFDHAGGGKAPVTTSTLVSTSLTPLPPPSDVDYFPLTKGLTGTYRWTNKKHLKQPEVVSASIDAVVNGSAQITVKSISGPIKLSGGYGYTRRIDGVTNIWGTTKAASLAKFPPLGPKSASAAKRRHFFTPFDLMDFGFNPLLPAYPKAGDSWSGAASGRDFEVFGVTGTSTVLGVQTVKVPAGTFQALAVRSVLVQAGFPFGSGTRTSWFAPGHGLVKLVFSHGDHSVSTVELLK